MKLILARFYADTGTDAVSDKDTDNGTTGADTSADAVTNDGTGADAVTDNDTGAETDARRILGPPLHQVDTQPLRCPLGQEEERKVSR